MASNLDTLVKNVDRLKTRFDQLRDDIICKLNECSVCIQTTDQLCREAIQIRTDLENKLVNASNEEKEWQDIKVKLATTSIKGKIILDVGGDKYGTHVDTLMREKETFFTALLSKQWELERDPDDKSIFIDRDGKLFHHILLYLRTDTVPNDTMNNESLRQLLLIEAKYFRLHNLIHILTEPERKRQKEEEERFLLDKVFPNGTLLQLEQKVKLNEFYGKNDQQWTLIYKASRDGFDANTFHTYCNDKGPTMTIIQSDNNYLFGGYTSISWTSDGAYKNDPTAFLFTLTNPHHISPTKYRINSASVGSAVYHHRSYGPVFGSGHSLCVTNASNLNKSSYTGFPGAYIDTTGKSQNTFTGTPNFTASEIEVFKLL